MASYRWGTPYHPQIIPCVCHYWRIPSQAHPQTQITGGLRKTLLSQSLPRPAPCDPMPQLLASRPLIPPMQRRQALPTMQWPSRWEKPSQNRPYDLPKMHHCQGEWRYHGHHWRRAMPTRPKMPQLRWQKWRPPTPCRCKKVPIKTPTLWHSPGKREEGQQIGQPMDQGQTQETQTKHKTGSMPPHTKLY